MDVFDRAYVPTALSQIAKNHAKDPYQQYLVYLMIAHISSQRALDALYSPSGVKRGLGYRLRLGRAQNALISLYVSELNPKTGFAAWFDEWKEQIALLIFGMFIVFLMMFGLIVIYVQPLVGLFGVITVLLIWAVHTLTRSGER